MNEAPPRAPLALRLAGVVVLLGLLGLLILWNMAVLAFPSGPLNWLPGTLVVLFLLFAVYATWKKIRIMETGRSVGLGAAVLLAGVVYLAWDDPTVTHPMKLQELVPPPAADAEASYQATLAFTKVGDQPAPRTQPYVKHTLKNSPVDKPAEWAKEVAANRAKVAANFATCAPGREWLAELDRFAEIGDIPKADLAGPAINFSVLRETGNALCNEAAALAQEGKGDEAFELLRLLGSVAVKLERHARTDMRLVVALRALQNTLATANHVLATTPVSPDKKAALAAAVANRDAAQIRHRLAWLNYTMFTEVFLKFPDNVLGSIIMDGGVDRFWARILGWTRPLTVLPRNTSNLLAEFSQAIERVLENPADANIASDNVLLFRRLQSPSPRNFGGRSLIMIAVPNYKPLGERLRATEQARLDLLAKLRG